MYQSHYPTNNIKIGYNNNLIPSKDNTQNNLFRLPSLSETFPEYFESKSNLNENASSTPTSENYKTPVFYNRNQTTIINDYSFSSRKPRIRKRYEEVERLYHCVYPGCHKSYGALNHLNSHIVTKGHGKKRTPHEFVELRKVLKMREEGHYSSLDPFYKSHSRNNMLSYYNSNLNL